MENDGKTREELIKEIAELKSELENVMSMNSEIKEIRYQELFHNTLNGIAIHKMIYDDDGKAENYRFVEANAAFEDHTGLVPSEIIGKTVIEVIPGIAETPFIEVYGKVAQGGDPIRFEQYAEPLNKHYDIYVYSPKKDYFATIFMDITDHKLLEIERENRNQELERLVNERTRELEEVQEKLLRNERLALIGELTAGVGHEIRNPISGISNAIFYLQNVIIGADEKVYQYLKLIDDEVKTVERILSELLNFSRVITPNKELINIDRTIRYIVEKTPKPDNILIDYDFPEKLTDVLIDEGQFSQVVENLHTNAMQAMLEGGKITFKGYEQENEVILEVIDEGVGISKENIEKIFEPLFTTKSKGFGLGLALVKRYIEANGCKIKVESKVGYGTKFIVAIPI